jgi:type 2 lantibiotic biosynthesis protein LanM
MARVKPTPLYKALFLWERRVHWSSALFFRVGLTKIRGWKKLSGFRKSPSNFNQRLHFDGLTLVSLIALLGQIGTSPKKCADTSWIQNLDTEYRHHKLDDFRGQFEVFDEFLERGVIAPFSTQIFMACRRIHALAKRDGHDSNAFFREILQTIEQLVIKSFVLTLNVSSMKGELVGENESERYQSFVARFNSPLYRQQFFEEYPVLFRIVVSRLDCWMIAVEELIYRLLTDRRILEKEFKISTTDTVVAVKCAGDTHNNGRSVTVLEFRSGAKIVYKPRSTSLERSFQSYLGYFNSVIPDLDLRKISVIDQENYGWVEFVHYAKPMPGFVSDRYHYKLGFLTAIVYSINGVDIFFENLIASGSDPVIIDLESMFHTSIDSISNDSPLNALQSALHASVTGIGVLPHPCQGSSETEVFDVTVLGAAVDAKAPYKVSGIKNFGRVDMKITEIPGWINEATSVSTDGGLERDTARHVFDGLSDGFECLRRYCRELIEHDGVIDRCFMGTRRRLIVRDTKVYGALQSDETHPDLVRDQVDREWHIDNLWAETHERPNLLRFIKSEIIQIRQGDIPYFYGSVDSCSVEGGDGSIIELEDILAETPISKAKAKIRDFSVEEQREQLRLAATSLALYRMPGVTQPELHENASDLQNLMEIVRFVTRRAKTLKEIAWFDTSYNPVPSAKDVDPVNVIPSDPFLYEGVLGLSMFLHDVWRVTGDQSILESSLSFVDAVLTEVDSNSGYSPSGFVGLSSVIYVVNRAVESGTEAYKKYESKLPVLLNVVSNKLSQERKLDFLIGIAGVGCAILPYVRRSSSDVGVRVLNEIYIRLTKSGREILRGNKAIDGLDYFRGFSHGISGLALALYRIGRYLNDGFSEEISTKLLLHEYELVRSGQWTDRHSYGGEPLVGWCHGSAGIALALSSMPEIIDRSKDVENYYELAVENTLKNYDYESKCLCHGTLGNLLCLQATEIDDFKIQQLKRESEIALAKYGFKSLGAAQTMSVGLMTGLVGAGYYLLGQVAPDTNFKFLSLD